MGAARTGARPRRVGAFRALVVAVITVAILGAWCSVATAVTIHEFTAGLASTPHPGAPVTGPDGNVWFTDTGAIGRITPSGAIAEFSQGIPSGDTTGDSIAVGADGALWFSLVGSSPAIGRLDPHTGAITHTALSSNANSVVEGPDGNIWFIGGGASSMPAIGYVTPAGVVTELTSFSDVAPSIEALAPGPGRTMWFLDDGSTYSVGYIDLTRTPYAPAETSSGVNPSDVLGNIAAGPDGNMWFTGSGLIGKVTLPSRTVTETFAGTQGLQLGAEPDEIMPGPDRAMWFDDQEFGADSVGKVDPATGAITEFALTSATTPWTISFGADGDLYAVQTGLVARITTAGQITDLPTPSASSGADNDVLTGGGDGNLYYNDRGSPPALVQINLDQLPTVVTGSPSAVTTTSATVGGSVTPLTSGATVAVRYGTTPSLGSTAPVGMLSASATASPVSASLTHLHPGTTIFYEFVATDATGTATGAVRSFTTLAPSSATARVGNQTLSLAASTGKSCVASSHKLTVKFRSRRGGGSPRLKFLGVKLSIGGPGRHHAGRSAVLTRAAATAKLTLIGLARGVHPVTAVASYSESIGGRRSHRTRKLTETLTVYVHVC